MGLEMGYKVVPAFSRSGRAVVVLAVECDITVSALCGSRSCTDEESQGIQVFSYAESS
jgi:hypothetical protein